MSGEQTYEFTAPEGVAVDPAYSNELSAVAKELNLAPEAAQKIYATGAKFAKAPVVAPDKYEFKPAEGGKLNDALAADVAATAKALGLTAEAAQKLYEAGAKHAPAPVAAPEKYDFKVPEGREADTELAAALTEIGKKHKLAPEVAQEVHDLGFKVADKFVAKLVADDKARRDGWTAAAKTDKEIGGEAYDKNLGVAKEAIGALATPEFVQFLNETGLGDHPEMIRTFFRVGQKLSEDSTVRGGEHQSGSSTFNYGKSTHA